MFNIHIDSLSDHHKVIIKDYLCYLLNVHAEGGIFGKDYYSNIDAMKRSDHVVPYEWRETESLCRFFVSDLKRELSPKP